MRGVPPGTWLRGRPEDAPAKVKNFFQNKNFQAVKHKTPGPIEIRKNSRIFPGRQLGKR